MQEQKKTASSAKEIILMPDLKQESHYPYSHNMKHFIQNSVGTWNEPFQVQASSPALTTTINNRPKSHGLVNTVMTAYNNHLPLELSPDDIWLAVCQGFCAHILENAEKLRKQFVDFDGKKQLMVRADTFVFGSPDNDWTQVFGDFSKQIKDNIGAKMHSIFIHQFTTTTPLCTTVYEATLVSAMQKYFDYGVMTLCGIPKVRLTGKPEDWKELRNKAAGIAKFGLDWWIEKLLPIIDKIVAAAVDGEKDRDFWNSVGKVVSPGGSGAIRYLNGWITNFFPYFNSSKNKNLRDLDEVLKTMKLFESKDFYQLSQSEQSSIFARMPPQQSIPLGLTQAPFTWYYYADEIPMQFISGFIGFEKMADGFIKPQIGWAIAQKKEKKKDEN